MNEQLLKFIELCLIDGVISDKEREVIFRKAKELGVPDDECEIILDGLLTKHKSKSQSFDFDTKIDENYIEESIFKSWFIDWLKTEKQFIQFKTNLSSQIKDFLNKEIDGSEKKGSISGDYIKEDTLLKMCELKHIPDIPDSFWKKGKKGKKGSVENKFKDKIKRILDKEKFICYLSSSVSQGLGGNQNFLNWGNRDLIQMIEHYNNPTKNLGEEGWYFLEKSPYTILFERDSVLITDKSIVELKETIKTNEYSFNKISLENISIETFTDEFGYFKMTYRVIESLFESDQLNVTSFLPKPIQHDNNKFISIIKSIGINDYTKRLINVDEKIQEFLDSKFTTQLKKLERKELYLFVFGTKRDVLGNDRIIIKEDSITTTLHQLSLKLFHLYIRFLTFRDSLLKMYLTKQEVELEGILLKFENSNLNMSKFEQDTLSTLNQINDNLQELKEITKIGLDEISEKLGLVVEELDSLNQSNEKIIESLNFNNFISLVNSYQMYKINKNTKSIG